MAAGLLQRCGEALYGERWHSQLALELGVAVRTVERWHSGQRATPPGVWPEIYRLLGGRVGEIAALRQELANKWGTDEQDRDGEAADAAVGHSTAIPRFRSDDAELHHRPDAGREN